MKTKTTLWSPRRGQLCPRVLHRQAKVAPTRLAALRADAVTIPRLPGQRFLFSAILPATLLMFLALSASAAMRYVDVNSVSPSPPYDTWATAATNIQDAVDVAVAGDEIVVTNGVYQTGGRPVDGTMTNRVAVDKPLTVRSVNGPEVTVIRGYQVPGTTNGDGAVRCVYLINGAVLSGFTLTNGATRYEYDYPTYRESSGGGVWCASLSAVVTNCGLTGNSAAYFGGGAAGGTLNNCTLTLNSASSGGGVAGATLNDCTLTGNSAVSGGGAAAVLVCVQSGGCSVSVPTVLNNCTLTGNAAQWGGGALAATLNRCALSGNSASYGGGAAAASYCIRGLCESSGTLNNCTLAGNFATNSGGGAYRGTLNNCIVYFNTATSGANYYQEQYSGILNYCCAIPLPTNGVGNFTNAPLFVDQGGGNLRLQANSHCINSGLNAYASGDLDLDGLSRIVGGTVDVGAYEFQSPQSAISYAWLQSFGLPTDGSVDRTDFDSDGLNNWQEWRCLTDPTNALSVLRLLSPSPTGSNVTVRWESMAGVSYFLERSTDLGGQPPFLPLATDLLGQAGTTTYLDTNALGPSRFFYRVGVEER